MKKCPVGHFLSFCIHAYALLSAGGCIEFDFAVCQCEERIVGSAAYVFAGMDVRSALTNYYVARENELTVASLDAEPLRTAVTSVLC